MKEEFRESQLLSEKVEEEVELIEELLRVLVFWEKLIHEVSLAQDGDGEVDIAEVKRFYHIVSIPHLDFTVRPFVEPACRKNDLFHGLPVRQKLVQRPGLKIGLIR